MFGFEFQPPVRIISTRSEFRTLRAAFQDLRVFAAHRRNHRRRLILTRIEHNLDLHQIGYPDLSLRRFTGVVNLGECLGLSLVIYESGRESPIGHYHAARCGLSVVLLIAQPEVFDSRECYHQSGSVR